MTTHKEARQSRIAQLCFLDLRTTPWYTWALWTTTTTATAPLCYFAWRSTGAVLGYTHGQGRSICMLRRLPAAVAPGRSVTVMSGGKWILGGSSTSASGPSAMVPKILSRRRSRKKSKARKRARRQLIQPKSTAGERSEGRTEAREDENKQTWLVWMTLGSLGWARCATSGLRRAGRI